MKLKLKLTSLLVLSSFIVCTSVIPAYSSKVGEKCSKSGLTIGVGTKKLTCSKKGKSLVWVKTPQIPVGSFSRPVPMGAAMKIGGIEYTVTRLNLDSNQVICASNPFNAGCKLDDELKSAVDPNSPVTWVTVSIRAKNLTSVIAKPGGFDKTFYLTYTNGQLLQEEDFVLFTNNFSELELITSGTGSGDVAFALPKSGPGLGSLLVLRDSSNLLKPKDYYFQISK